jgi:hypothetical protein
LFLDSLVIIGFQCLHIAKNFKLHIVLVHF